MICTEAYNWIVMLPTIKVTSRFATPYDTARVLGIPKSRTDEIVERVRKITDRMLRRSSANGELTAREKSTVSGAKKNRRNVTTKARKTKSKTSKSR